MSFAPEQRLAKPVRGVVNCGFDAPRTLALYKRRHAARKTVKFSGFGVRIMSEPPRATELLARAAAGSGGAREQLWQVMYGELHRLAAACVGPDDRNGTLQPTALVNELCLRLLRNEPLAARNRHQFLAIAAKAMRHILVDHVRARRRLKRGGGRQAVPLDEQIVSDDGQDLDVIELHEALEQLGAMDERLARVVELRYFGGLKFEEVAAVVGVAEKTARRDWEAARTWLWRHLLKGRRDG